MASEVVAGFSVFKSLLDVAKGLKDLNDTAAVNAAVVELQEKILAAQEAQTALAKRKEQLEKEVSQLKAWDREKERYELREVDPPNSGVFAYALKSDAEGSEPFHLLCPNCYEDHKKSILQSTGETYLRLRVHVCPRCEAVYRFGKSDPPAHSGKAHTEFDPFDF